MDCFQTNETTPQSTNGERCSPQHDPTENDCSKPSGTTGMAASPPMRLASCLSLEGQTSRGLSTHGGDAQPPNSCSFWKATTMTWGLAFTAPQNHQQPTTKSRLRTTHGGYDQTPTMTGWSWAYRGLAMWLLRQHWKVAMTAAKKSG